MNQREIKFRIALQRKDCEKDDSDFPLNINLRPKDKNGKTIGINWHYLTLEELARGELKLDRFEIRYANEFTGLKDSRGREIYEGDIVTFYMCQDEKGGMWISLYRDYREWRGVVAFKDGKYGLGKTKYVGKTSKKMQLEIDKYDEWWEVIGNIYENPELLK